MVRRIILGITPLVVCGIGAVAADFEHFTSITFGTAWSYGLHSKTAYLVCIVVLIALSCGLSATILLGGKNENK